MRISAALGLLAVAVSTACGPASPSAGQGPSGQSTAATPKNLTLAITEDPGNIWDGLTGGGGSGSRELGQMVNQFLTTTASDGTIIPRLLSTAFRSNGVPGELCPTEACRRR